MIGDSLETPLHFFISVLISEDSRPSFTVASIPVQHQLTKLSDAYTHPSGNLARQFRHLLKDGVELLRPDST